MTYVYRGYDGELITFQEWNSLCARGRTVKRTRVWFKGAVVSTVYLGADLEDSELEGERVYETMVFAAGDPDAGAIDVFHWRTYGEALVGHGQVVARIKRGRLL